MTHQARAGADREFQLTNADYASIVARVRKASGIVLAEGKQDLVYGRLAPRLRKLGCSNFADYLALLNQPDNGGEQIVLLNAITTNLTGFFRESHHFDALAANILPELTKAGRPRRLRIWSAGCSSGQEPYTVAMVIRKAIPDIKSWNALILATDIDSNMIAHGQAGLFDAETAESIPPDYRRFVLAGEHEQIRMPHELKALIRFKCLNLMADWPMAGPFDIIFCRNVVIYFDKDTQRILFDRFADILRPDGWLFIGHSESLHRISERFTHLGHTVYRRSK